MLILFQTPNIIFVIQNAGVKFYAAQALIRYPLTFENLHSL
jgi:hypothetical protein